MDGNSTQSVNSTADGNFTLVQTRNGVFLPNDKTELEWPTDYLIIALIGMDNLYQTGTGLVNGLDRVILLNSELLESNRKWQLKKWLSCDVSRALKYLSNHISFIYSSASKGRIAFILMILKVK